jgi:integrase
VTTRFLPDVARHLKPSGRKNYGYLLERHVLPVIGDRRLEEITFQMIQEGLVGKMLDAGYAVQTVKHVRSVTGAVFKHAVRTRDFTGSFPTFGVRLPQMKRKPKHALTIPQARAVLEALKSPYREMALLSMTTSMNLAEMCALRWKCLNLSDEHVLADGENIPPHCLAVRENFYQGTFTSPKTVNRRRCVALPVALVAELTALKGITRFSTPDDIVFATHKGTPKHASNLHNRVIKPVGKVLGIPWLHWHCLRNTFATLGEQLGIALSDRQAQMGHGTVWMTQEYTVSEVGRRRAGAELIARSIAC